MQRDTHKPHTQDTHKTHNSQTIKKPKTKGILKASREKWLLTAEEISVILTADSSSATMETQRRWDDIFKGKVSYKNRQPRNLYGCRIFFKTEGAIKILSDMQKEKNPNRISITGRAALQVEIKKTLDDSFNPNEEMKSTVKVSKQVNSRKQHKCNFCNHLLLISDSKTTAQGNYKSALMNLEHMKVICITITAQRRGGNRTLLEQRFFYTFEIKLALFWIIDCFKLTLMVIPGATT